MACTRIIPMMVVQKVTINVGKIMSAGDCDPAVERSPITVVGSSWMEVAFTTTSIIMAKVALPEPSSSRCIALMPVGVEALPSPSMFAERFNAMIFWVSWSSILKIFFISGRNSFANFSPRPLASTISIIPSQTA